MASAGLLSTPESVTVSEPPGGGEEESTWSSSSSGLEKTGQHSPGACAPTNMQGVSVSIFRTKSGLKLQQINCQYLLSALISCVPIRGISHWSVVTAGVRE